MKVSKRIEVIIIADSGPLRVSDGGIRIAVRQVASSEEGIQLALVRSERCVL